MGGIIRSSFYILKLHSRYSGNEVFIVDVIDKLMLSYKGFLLFSKIHRHVSRLIIHCGYHWQFLVERSAGAENLAF